MPVCKNLVQIVACLSLPVCVTQLRAEAKGRAAAVSNDDGLWMMISRSSLLTPG